LEKNPDNAQAKVLLTPQMPEPSAQTLARQKDRGYPQRNDQAPAKKIRTHAEVHIPTELSVDPCDHNATLPPH
ncbi:hypothetical protein AAGG49_22865, partial [Stenotrophomonas maltophilia]|uniref:hypothetical protein n=1 Tax=Stenotrophomonas maltophilia TaxID=40324 RepID=UPI00313E483C